MTQLSIQYAPDLILLSQVSEQGGMIASEETDKFGALTGLVETGTVSKVLWMGDIYQFCLTQEGERVLG